MATFATLKSDIASWMRRGDLTSVIPSFVAMAETEIFRTHPYALRVREMETTATLTVTNLTATLPADYVEGRHIKTDSGKLLSYIPSADWVSSNSGFFTIIGSTIHLPLDTAGSLTLVYWAQPAALSGDSDTNDVLNAYYAAYLKASIRQALLYIRDAAGAQVAQAEIDAILKGAANNAKPAISAPLQVRAG